MEHLAKQNDQESSQRFGILKRKHQRTGVHGFLADIADGNIVLNGVITDISSGGFRLARLAASFVVEKHCYCTIISGEGRHYKVLAKPCWSKMNSSSQSQEIGFKIIDASWEWTEFVLNTASDADYEDDWGYHA